MECGLLILGDHLADPTTGVRARAPARHRQFVELGALAEAQRFTPTVHGARPRVGAVSHVHVARDRETARARWRPHHLRYLEWVANELVPWAGANVGPRDAQMPQHVRFDFDQLCEKGPALCGSADDVAERLSALQRTLGLDLHLAMFDHGALPEPLLRDSLERYAAEVLPRVQSGRPEPRPASPQAEGAQ